MVGSIKKAIKKVQFAIQKSIDSSPVLGHHPLLVKLICRQSILDIRQQQRENREQF